MSGYQFTFPSKCACCCSETNTQLSISASKSSGKRVVHTKTQVWDVPYCDRCTSHLKAVNEAAALTKAVTFLSLVLACVLWVFTAAYIGLPVGTLGIVCAVIVYNQKMTQARSMCSVSCASVGLAISYLGWYGTVHEFEIGSLNFAHEFMLANQRKLVNLTAEAQQLLASSGAVPTPDAPRSARRYMT